MTTADRLEAWRAAGVITDAQHASLAAVVRQERFSVFVELSALLYVGVLSLVGGLVWTFRDYVANLGDVAILSILTLLMTGAFYYCFSRTGPYSHDEVEPPSLAFDYVLYFGCLVFAATLAYLETQLGVFRGWDTHLLIASFVFGGLAYRFDNRLVLSLAMSTLAGYLGLKLEAFEAIDTDILRFYALGYGLFLAVLGYLLHQRGIKAHFFEVYLHVSTNIFLVAAASGVLSPSLGLFYLALLLAMAGAAIYLGVRFKRFAFVAYGTLYGYAGLSMRLLSSFGSVTTSLTYFAVTGTLVVVGLVVLARRFGRDE